MMQSIFKIICVLCAFEIASANVHGYLLRTPIRGNKQRNNGHDPTTPKKRNHGSFSMPREALKELQRKGRKVSETIAMSVTSPKPPPQCRMRNSKFPRRTLRRPTLRTGGSGGRRVSLDCFGRIPSSASFIQIGDPDASLDESKDSSDVPPGLVTNACETSSSGQVKDLLSKVGDDTKHLTEKEQSAWEKLENDLLNKIDNRGNVSTKDTMVWAQIAKGLTGDVSKLWLGRILFMNQQNEKIRRPSFRKKVPTDEINGKPKTRFSLDVGRKKACASSLGSFFTSD